MEEQENRIVNMERSLAAHIENNKQYINERHDTIARLQCLEQLIRMSSRYAMSETHQARLILLADYAQHIHNAIDPDYIPF